MTDNANLFISNVTDVLLLLFFYWLIGSKYSYLNPCCIWIYQTKVFHKAINSCGSFLFLFTPDPWFYLAGWGTSACS